MWIPGMSDKGKKKWNPFPYDLENPAKVQQDSPSPGLNVKPVKPASAKRGLQNSQTAMKRKRTHFSRVLDSSL